MWLCPCGAYTGCHAGGERPKGRPAGKATRTARQAAHKAFDALWAAKIKRDGCSKAEARRAGYKWLATTLDLPPAQCHIGFMDLALAQRVIQICRRK